MRYMIFSNDNSAPLKIALIGFGTGNEYTRFAKKRRDLYIIHYVTKGEGVYNGNPVKCGQGFLMIPGDVVHYYGNPENPWELLWIISNDSSMEEIFERYGADPVTRIFNYDAISTVKHAAEKIVERANSTVDSLMLLEMFLHILNRHTYTRSAEGAKSSAGVYLDFCVDYIENNINKKITVEELTGLLGVSQPYLYKIFRSRFGVSVKEYVTELKMERAKNLLEKTDMSVTEVARRVGFGDVLSFSKAFKASEGASPLKHREKFGK